MSRLARARPVATVLLAGAAGSAGAHSPIQGIGTFYSGALHPFIAPALLIALLALGLLLGQNAHGRLTQAKRPLVGYAVALLLGLYLHAWAGDPDTDRLLLAFGAAAGVAVAAAWRAPVPLNIALAVAVGLAVGVASGPSGVGGRAYTLMVVGTALGSIFLPSWVAIVVSAIEPPWARIAVRVLGSWLAAAALLVLSLSFAPARLVH